VKDLPSFIAGLNFHCPDPGRIDLIDLWKDRGFSRCFHARPLLFHRWGSRSGYLAFGFCNSRRAPILVLDDGLGQSAC
jgi:hypothetical protein